MRITSFLLFCGSIAMLAWDNPSQSSLREQKRDKFIVNTSVESHLKQQDGDSVFDIRKIPVSDRHIGLFPFFRVPDGFKYGGTENYSFHRIYELLNGKLVPVEGKTFQTHVYSYGDFDSRQFESDYDDMIKNAGGVLVSEGKVSTTEINRVGDKELSYYGGPADIYNDPVKTFLIRRPDKQIWVQTSHTSAGGSLVVTVKEKMQQTASINRENNKGYNAGSYTNDPVLGIFPFFGPPDGFSYTHVKSLKYERMYHWMDGKLVAVEGKTFEATVSPYGVFEPLTFERNYDQLIKSVGGKLIADGRISEQELNRVGNDELYSYGGPADIWNDPVKTYLIQRNGEEIYVQTSHNSASGSLVVSVKSRSHQMTSVVRAEELKNVLYGTGRVAVPVRFDTDKATIRPGSMAEVDQIYQLLKNNPDLKLMIEGYADGLANLGHSQVLSQDRADAVKQILMDRGIDANRLKSEGTEDSASVAQHPPKHDNMPVHQLELLKM